MAMLVPWLAWLLVSLLAAYFLELYAHARRDLPPGPRPLPLIGSLHLLGDQPHRSLARLAKFHGPLMSLRLGVVTTVAISSPDVALSSPMGLCPMPSATTRTTRCPGCRTPDAGAPSER
jgi:hypothetical protein